MGKSKYIFIGFIATIVVLIGIFAIQVYSGTKSSGNISSDRISITESKGKNPNEVIVTVNTDSKDVLYYSFDGGISFQTENSHAISENKEIRIVLKNSNGNIIGEKTHVITVVESQEPPKVIINNFPSIIYIGDTIDLSKYATATDSKGNKLAVNIEPSAIDTSIEGTYTINYSATDSNNLTSSINVELNVIAKPNNGGNGGNEDPTPKRKQTYYSYRTKSTTVYECNYYQCDYIDYNGGIDGTVNFDQNSYCCNVEGCKKENPKIDICQLCIQRAGTICPFCHEQFTSEYAIRDNVCYSKIPLKKAPQQVNDPNCKNCLPVYSMFEEPKTECDTGEMLIDGVCHKVDSYATITCPNEYILKDGKCYREIKQTCSNQCTNESWSNWSEWSTTKVVASDTTEVRTMEK